MLFCCFFSQNELYSMVRKIVENDNLTTEVHVSGIMGIQRMKGMIFFSEGSKILIYKQLTSELEFRQNSREY